MRDFAHSLADFHHPVTFRSRGVAAPFTTPRLAGSRVRRNKRAGIELVVPNPSGGRGIYVLDWPGVRAMCCPTVHDTLLFERAQFLGTIDPASIREAALDVAREGYAGREAAAAAEIAIEREAGDRALVRCRLVTALVEQCSPAGVVTQDAATALDRRAQAVLQRIAVALRRPAGQLDDSLTLIARQFAPIGFAPWDREARIPRLLMRLDEAYSALVLWLRDDPDNDVGGLGRAVGAAMRRAIDSGLAVLRKTRVALSEAPGLLKRWVSDPAGVSAAASRCDWLLDGWEWVSLLWLDAATTASRRAALLQMAALVPVLPREVAAWADTPIASGAMQPVCQVAWRGGASAFGVIERNERIIALGALGGVRPGTVSEGS